MNLAHSNSVPGHST